jgi:PPOX class probable F420-dependent enzyme
MNAKPDHLDDRSHVIEILPNRPGLCIGPRLEHCRRGILNTQRHQRRKPRDRVDRVSPIPAPTVKPAFIAAIKAVLHHAIVARRPNVDAMSITDEKYVSFTTFTKDGEPKPSPVWIVGLGDGQAAFTTEADSWKVKRLKNNPQITLQPSNMKGDVTAGSAEVTGSATFVQGAEADHVQALVKKKYSPTYYLVQLINKLRGLFGSKPGENGAVIITLD